MANKAVELLINLKTTGAKELDKLIKNIGGVSKTAESSASGFNKLDNAIDETTGSSKALGKTADELAKELEDQANSIKRAGNSFDNYNKEAKRGEVLTSKMRGTVGKLRLGFVGLAVAAAGVVTAFASIRGISNTTDKFDLMSNAAERARTSIERLQAAEYAAGTLAGKTWDDMSKAFDTMGRRISRFVETEGGPAAKALEQIEGFDASKIVDLDAIDQLKELSNAMKDMSNIERQDILFQLGGDNLKDLANGLKDSNDSFFELIEKAQEADWVLSSIETDRLANLNGTITDINTSFNAMKERYLAQLAPALRVIGDWFMEMTKNASSFGKESGTLSKSLVRGFQSLLKIMNFTQASFRSLEWVTLKFTQGMVSAVGYVVDVWDTAVNKTVEGGLSLLEGGLRIAGKFSDKAKKMADEIANYTPGKSTTGKYLKDLGEHIGKSADEALTKVYDALDREIPDFESDLKIILDEESARVASEDAVDKAQHKLDENPLNLTVVANIDTARRALEDALYNIAKNNEKRKTQLAIDSINHEKSIALKALDDEKATGELANENYYAQRLRLEIDTNNKIASMRQEMIDTDIAGLERQRVAMVSAMDDIKKGTEEYIKAQEELAKLDNEIDNKESERQQIDVNKNRRNQSTNLDEVSRQVKEQTRLEEEARKKAKDAAEKDREEAEKLAEQAAEKRKRLEQEVFDVKMDLLKETGNESDAQIKLLENKYGELLSELEKDSEDAKLVEKLLDVKKAQIQLDDLRSELEKIRSDFESGAITRDEYNVGVNDLTPKLNDTAMRTENDDVIESTRRMTEEYRNFGDVAFQVGEVVGNRFAGLTDGIHSVIMGTSSLKDAFHQMAAGIIADLLKMIIQQQIFNALQAASGAIGGGFGAGLASIGLNHTGGYIGAGSARRSVPMSIFANAPRKHKGGLIGADEVPIIAQKGEYMIDKYDIRNPKNGGNGSTPGQSGGGGQAVNITNMIDSASVAGAMDTPDGRNAIINVIRAERATIKSIL